MNTNDPDKSLSPSERKRLANMGLERFAASFDVENPALKGPLDVLVGRIQLAHSNVQLSVFPIIKSGGCVPTPENKLGMQKLLQQLYVEQFAKFSKDELEQALAWVYTSTAMEGLFTTKLGKGPKI